MNTRQLTVLAVVFFVLVTIGYYIKQPRPVDIEAAIGARALVPDKITPDNVTAIEFAVGKEKPAVRLKKQGDAWRIETAWNVAADADKVTKFIKDLIGLRGELRSENAAMHSDYGVADDQGLHVRLYTAASGEQAAFELLAGKKPTGGYGASFVRVAGENTTYRVDKDIRSDIGIWEDDLKKEPGNRHWIKSCIAKCEKDKMVKVELVYPDRSLILEKVAKPQPADNKGEGEEVKAEGKNDDKKAEPKKEYEWKIVSASPVNIEFKKEEINNILDAVCKIEIDDAADPAKKAELGLDSPNHRLIITQEGDEKIEMLASRQRDKEGQMYVYLASAPDMVYSMTSWQFERIFKKGSDLFTISTPSFAKDKIRSLVFKRKDEIVRLERADDKSEWKILSPDSGFMLKQDPVNQIAEGLSTWKATDYADPEGTVKYGLALPACTLEIGVADGAAGRLILGSAHKAYKASYVTADPQNQPILLMSSYDVDKIFPPLANLLDLAVFADLKSEDVASFTVSAKGKPSLRGRRKIAKDAEGKESETWEIEQDGKTAEGDKSLCQDYLNRLLGLKASGLLAAEEIADAFSAEECESIAFETSKGKFELILGKAKENGDRPARSSTRRASFIIAKDTAIGLLPEASALLPPPPKTEASTTVVNPLATEGKDGETVGEKTPAADDEKADGKQDENPAGEQTAAEPNQAEEKK